MKKIGFLILFFVFIPISAFADTIVSTAISIDTTWSPSAGIYIINEGFSVAPGITLTVEPGTIIKAKTQGYNLPNIYGKIKAHGTSEAPIYFTSFWNDNIGGDTDGNPSVEVGNHWQGLYFKAGSTGDFDYVNISYAGALLSH